MIVGHIVSERCYRYPLNKTYIRVVPQKIKEQHSCRLNDSPFLLFCLGYGYKSISNRLAPKLQQRTLHVSAIPKITQYFLRGQTNIGLMSLNWSVIIIIFSAIFDQKLIGSVAWLRISNSNLKWCKLNLNIDQLKH